MAAVAWTSTRRLAIVARRFADLDVLSRTDRSRAAGDGNVPPLRVALRAAWFEGAKLLYEPGGARPLPPLSLDGHHRLFAARAFGFHSALAEVAADEAEPVDLAMRLATVLGTAVPPDATVAVLNRAGDQSPPVDPYELVPFPHDDASALTDRDLIELLERGHIDDGWQFLVVPGPAIAWLETRTSLRAHLDERYRLAAREPDTCLLYVLWPDADESEAVGADGLPVPPVEMRQLSAQDPDGHRFVEGGREALAWIDPLVRAHGPALADTQAILDFGCGAGRVLRHLPRHGARVGGMDCNPYLSAWVREHLPFVDTRVSPLAPTGAAADNGWDLVLATDVFTHLDVRLQTAWAAELARMTKPGSLVVLTVAGAGRAHELPAQARAAFNAGRPVVRGARFAGTNACRAYHPADAIDDVFEVEGLELLEHVPDMATDVDQDAVLLRRGEVGSG